MTSMPEAPAGGLRERKKARVRHEIQQNALRLFRTQGFHQTTVEQIAAEAEVAPSTVFRYFPRKEDLAVLDTNTGFNDLIISSYRSQPASLTASEALGRTLKEVFDSLSPAERDERTNRDLGLLRVPELWAANIPYFLDALDTIASLVAERTQRPEGDPAVRALVGAAFGIGLELLMRDPTDTADFAPVFEQRLAALHRSATM